jgi:hypothetical protein
MSGETQRIIIRREGKDFGPYTHDEATLYLKTGQLFHSDTARLEGGDSWLSLATILGVSAPPPPPPLSMPAAVRPQVLPVQSVPDEELLRLFVGPNYDYYARKWKVFGTKRNRISWNWAGFVFGLGWLFYRKMYLYAWIVIGIAFLMVVFELTTGLRGAYIDVLIAVYCGGFGNYVYQEHCRRKLREIAPSGVADEMVRLRIAREGGTNIAAGIIPAAIWLVLNIVGIVAALQ